MTRDYSTLSGETITIRRTSWKTPSFMYVVLIFGVAFPVMYVFASGMQSLPVVVPVIVGIFTVLNLRVWGLLTKVTIGPEGIVVQSPVKTRTFRWNQIQTTGMYIVSRNRKESIPPQRYNEKFYLRLKYVWFSTYPHTEPGMFRFNNELYGDFEFNAEAWELMKKFIANQSGNVRDAVPGMPVNHVS